MAHHGSVPGRLPNPRLPLTILPLLTVLATTAPAAATVPLDQPAGARTAVTGVERPGVNPTAGPLFFAGLDRPHSCSAAVVASPSRDLVLTAAHCIIGSGVGAQFVPGYSHGKSPYGVWTAVAAYVDPAWISDRDPEHDVAILKLGKQEQDGLQLGVEDVVGGNLLGTEPADHTGIEVPAYPMNVDDPTNCRAESHHTGDYPTFDCPGYPGGTSGAPFLVPLGPPDGRTYEYMVVGVIGGLHQGGCRDDTSYSSPFGEEVNQLWLRASTNATPDVVPSPGSSHC